MNRMMASQWRPDGTGIEAGGDIGGDIQAGDAYSVRYIRPDRPRAMITVSFYAVEYDHRPGEFSVQRQIEWLVCEDPADPGGTEIWSDYDYADMVGVVACSAEDASTQAREWAGFVIHRGDTHRWDGYSDPGAAFRPQGDHWACWRCGSQDFTTAGACSDCGQAVA